MARDRSLSGQERRKFQEEEKVRGIRNKQKRNKFSISNDYFNILIGSALITIASIGIVYVVSNDLTIVGAVDDVLLVPLVAWVSEGTKLILA